MKVRRLAQLKAFILVSQIRGKVQEKKLTRTQRELANIEAELQQCSDMENKTRLRRKQCITGLSTLDGAILNSFRSRQAGLHKVRQMDQEMSRVMLQRRILEADCREVQATRLLNLRAYLKESQLQKSLELVLKKGKAAIAERHEQSEQEDA